MGKDAFLKSVLHRNDNVITSYKKEVYLSIFRRWKCYRRIAIQRRHLWTNYSHLYTLGHQSTPFWTHISCISVAFQHSLIHTLQSSCDFFWCLWGVSLPNPLGQAAASPPPLLEMLRALPTPYGALTPQPLSFLPLFYGISNCVMTPATLDILSTIRGTLLMYYKILPASYDTFHTSCGSSMWHSSSIQQTLTGFQQILTTSHHPATFF